MTSLDESSLDVAWRGLDDDTRLDVASIDFADDGGFVATGRQSTETYRVQWDLVVDARWRTKLLTLDAEGYGDVSRETGLTGPAEDGMRAATRHEDGAARDASESAESPRREPVWQRHLNLWRRDDGSTSIWRCEGAESGDVPRHFGPVGFDPEMAALFADAVDVDLSGCPLTNVMPIRRFGVDAAGVGERPITAAWVSLPDLSVIPSSQVYSSGPEGLSEAMSVLDPRVFSVVHYRSATRDVSVDLSVDANGLVLTYPDLAARIELV